MAGSWSTDRFPQFEASIRRLTNQHRELVDEPLHLAISYQPATRDQRHIFLFEVIGGVPEKISSEQDLFETTFLPDSGFSMRPNEQLHLILTSPQELKIGLRDGWPLANEIVDAIRNQDYLVLHSDETGANSSNGSRMRPIIRRKFVDEMDAWLNQAFSDHKAAELLFADKENNLRCHSIAKWQQVVEKSVKAMVCALFSAKIVGAGVRAKHEVTRYVGVLIRLPRAADNKSIQQHLHSLLDPNTRAAIKAIDELAPQFPPQRNTEYPFQDTTNRWTYPAANDIFSIEESRRFRELAHRILNGAGWIVSAIRRKPR